MIVSLKRQLQTKVICLIHLVENFEILQYLVLISLLISSRECSDLGQLQNKLKISLSNIARKDKLSLLYLISKFSCSRIVIKSEILSRNLTVIYYVLYK